MLNSFVVRQVGAFRWGQLGLFGLPLIFPFFFFVQFPFFRVFTIFRLFALLRFGGGLFLVSFVVMLFLKLLAFVFFFLVGEICPTGQGIGVRTSLRFLVLGL